MVDISHEVMTLIGSTNNCARNSLQRHLKMCRCYRLDKLSMHFGQNMMQLMVVSNRKAFSATDEFETFRFDFIKFSLGERYSVVYIIYPSCEFCMSWFVASDQCRQLSLMCRRHKVKADLPCTDEAQNKAKTRVCSYLAPCNNYIFTSRSPTDI